MSEKKRENVNHSTNDKQSDCMASRYLYYFALFYVTERAIIAFVFLLTWPPARRRAATLPLEMSSRPAACHSFICALGGNSLALPIDSAGNGDMKSSSFPAVAIKGWGPVGESAERKGHTRHMWSLLSRCLLCRLSLLTCFCSSSPAVFLLSLL